MEIIVKLASRDFERLRSGIPDGSPALEAMGRATRIDHSVGGVVFEGFTVPCDTRDARRSSKSPPNVVRK